jgi:hypothetical protein
MKTRNIYLVLLLTALAAGLPVQAADGVDHSSLKTVEGVVTGIDRVSGEGGVEILQVTLGGTEGADPLSFLLAPAEALQSIGFEVREGDRLKVKCFFEGDGPARVHKIMNVSRGSMVRLRTLRQIPLWDNRGLWQGGPILSRPGAGGGHNGRN